MRKHEGMPVSHSVRMSRTKAEVSQCMRESRQE